MPNEVRGGEARAPASANPEAASRGAPGRERSSTDAEPRTLATKDGGASDDCGRDRAQGLPTHARHCNCNKQAGNRARLIGSLHCAASCKITTASNCALAARKRSGRSGEKNRGRARHPRARRTPITAVRARPIHAGAPARTTKPPERARVSCSTPKVPSHSLREGKTTTAPGACNGRSLPN